MNWNPGAFIIRFSDTVGSNRTESSVTKMIKDISKIAKNYGFNLSCYGHWEFIRKIMEEEKRSNILETLRSIK